MQSFNSDRRPRFLRTKEMRKHQGRVAAGASERRRSPLGDMKSLRGFDWVNDWSAWRDHVKERIAVAHRFGVPDETVRAIATKVGDLLAKKAYPTTREEKLLKEMWKVATPDEKKTLTVLILKMVE